MKTLKANEGKVFAYKDNNNEEIVLGDTLYLGCNDDGSRYYEIDKLIDENKEVSDNGKNDTI